MPRYEEISCEFVCETDLAVCVNEGGDDVWIPKSQINEPDFKGVEKGECISLEITEWIAKEKMLI